MRQVNVQKLNAAIEHIIAGPTSDSWTQDARDRFMLRIGQLLAHDTLCVHLMGYRSLDEFRETFVAARWVEDFILSVAGRASYSHIEVLYVYLRS